MAALFERTPVVATRSVAVMLVPVSSDTADDVAGLCASCVHMRIVESARGSRFVLCGLSATDPRFAKYPRLPVVQCSGYATTPAEGVSE